MIVGGQCSGLVWLLSRDVGFGHLINSINIRSNYQARSRWSWFRISSPSSCKVFASSSTLGCSCANSICPIETMCCLAFSCTPMCLVLELCWTRPVTEVYQDVIWSCSARNHCPVQFFIWFSARISCFWSSIFLGLSGSAEGFDLLYWKGCANSSHLRKNGWKLFMIYWFGKCVF